MTKVCQRPDHDQTVEHNYVIKLKFKGRNSWNLKEDNLSKCNKKVGKRLNLI